jgi:hypothetical protein
MKRYTYKIAKWNASDILVPIRSKKDSIKLLMKAIKIMITYQEVPEEDAIGSITLQVSKMSRLFFFSEGRFFSIIFPFAVVEADGGLSFSSKYMADIDSRATSCVLGFLSSIEHFESSCIYEFADLIISLEETANDIWPLIRELLMHEDGYVRYDHDSDNENGAMHPLHHLDVFYSSRATFKLGLCDKLEEHSLVDILSTETECSYLRSPEAIG